MLSGEWESQGEWERGKEKEEREGRGVEKG